MKLYLSGPMRGYPRFNYEAFLDAAQQLRKNHYEVVSPVEMDIEDGMDFTSDETIAATVKRDLNGNPDQEYYLTRDKAIMATCHGMALLPGWEHSTGCSIEIDRAHELYMPMRVIGEWLENAEFFQNRHANIPESPSDTERIVIDPNTGGAKGVKLARFSLMPTQAVWELAEHYGKCGGDGTPGSEKYDARNWERGYAWSQSYDAARRHLDEFWMGQNIDPKTRTKHVIAAAWHCLTLATYLNRGLGVDDRPLLGATP